MKSEKRKKMLGQKRLNKANTMGTPGFKSNYAKKRLYLAKHGGWGWEHSDKPWKGKK